MAKIITAKPVWASTSFIGTTTNERNWEWANEERTEVVVHLASVRYACLMPDSVKEAIAGMITIGEVFFGSNDIVFHFNEAETKEIVDGYVREDLLVKEVMRAFISGIVNGFNKVTA